VANPKIVTPPASEPVTLTEVKAQTRVDFTTDDTLLTSLITAAREKVEDFLGRKLIQTTLDYFLDDFPGCDFIELPNAAPLISIGSLKYTDADGDETTWDAANYFAATAREPGALVLAYGNVWPSVTLKPREAIVVRYNAGYGSSASDVPLRIKQAILMTISELYAHRGDDVPAPGQRLSGTIPEAAQALLWPIRMLST
jgi:uncharacterized phiE125 gp8 family phage protein